jgi:L-threonylcarbamoyladenylate synthase
LRIGNPGEFKAALARAKECLASGQVVAVPTETVYGLAANALDPKAVARIFAAKGRPAVNPLIVHVAGIGMARRCSAEWPRRAAKLAAAFWPGPLTLVLARSSLIPDRVVAGGTTVALRWPRHEFMEALIRLCGFPLAAPSANPSMRTSPTTARHVWDGLAGKIPLIIDGGPTPVGIESTVVDMAAHPPRLLRPGMIPIESIRSVAGPVGLASRQAGQALRSPGLMKKHYAPRARLVLTNWTGPQDLESQIRRLGFRPEATHVLASGRMSGNIPVGRIAVLPREATAFARNLYAELHRCDASGAELILVETPPDLPEWQGIRDRLKRAAE